MKTVGKASHQKVSRITFFQPQFHWKGMCVHTREGRVNGTLSQVSALHTRNGILWPTCPNQPMLVSKINADIRVSGKREALLLLRVVWSCDGHRLLWLNRLIISKVRDDLPKKRMFTFGHWPNQGRETPPWKFWPSFHHFLIPRN